MAHPFAVPLLATPAPACRVDDAGATSAAARVFGHPLLHDVGFAAFCTARQFQVRQGHPAVRQTWRSILEVSPRPHPANAPLRHRGCQVVGLDFRGHGQSDKPHDAGAYGTANVARHVTALLDHLGMVRVDLVAYSIGTAIALHLLQTAPERLHRVALVATGDGLIGLPPHEFTRILPALAAVVARSEYPKDLPRHAATYWNFIEATGGDRVALKAFAEASYPPLSVADAQRITHPVLVVSGENDLVLGRGPRLAGALGNARYLEVPGTDHFSLAADGSVREAVASFIDAQDG